jgi:hypothetical protein
MGMRVPVKNMELIVKADYQVGLQMVHNYMFYQYCGLGVGIRKK